MLIARVATALVGIPLVLVLIWFGGLPFGIACTLLAALAGWEACRLLGCSDGSLWSIVTISGAAALAAAGAFGETAIVAVLAVILIVTLSAFLATGEAGSRGTYGWAECLAAIAYAGLPLSLLCMIRQWTLAGTVAVWGIQLSYGARWVLLTLTTVWAVDTGAYVVGHLLGRRRLWPRVSPKKTWEGTIAGLVAGGIVFLIWSPVVGIDSIAAMALGLAIGCSAVIGDLVESALKRAADVKDTSALLPGHGGILDRIDSLSFAVIVVFLTGMVTELARNSAL